MSPDTRPKMQVFFGIEDPSRIRLPNLTGHIPAKPQTATHVALSSQSQPQNHQVAPNNNPIVNVMQELQKVDLSSPEAELNKDSMDDGRGGRITFNDELTGSTTFKGVEDPTRLPNKKK